MCDPWFIRGNGGKKKKQDARFRGFRVSHLCGVTAHLEVHMFPGGTQCCCGECARKFMKKRSREIEMFRNNVHTSCVECLMCAVCIGPKCAPAKPYVDVSCHYPNKVNLIVSSR